MAWIHRRPGFGTALEEFPDGAILNVFWREPRSVLQSLPSEPYKEDDSCTDKCHRLHLRHRQSVYEFDFPRAHRITMLHYQERGKA